MNSHCQALTVVVSWITTDFKPQPSNPLKKQFGQLKAKLQNLRVKIKKLTIMNNELKHENCEV